YMQTFNRLFSSLAALVWVALLAGLVFIVWREGQTLAYDSSSIHASVGLNLSLSEQILATIVLLALMMPALALIGIEMFRPTGERREPARLPDRRYQELETRMSRIESRLGGPAESPQPVSEEREPEKDPERERDRPRNGPLGWRHRQPHPTGR